MDFVLGHLKTFFDGKELVCDVLCKFVTKDKKEISFCKSLKDTKYFIWFVIPKKDYYFIEYNDYKTARVDFINEIHNEIEDSVTIEVKGGKL